MFMRDGKMFSGGVKAPGEFNGYDIFQMLIVINVGDIKQLFHIGIGFINYFKIFFFIMKDI